MVLIHVNTLQDVLCKLLVLVVQACECTACRVEDQAIDELVALRTSKCELEAVAETRRCSLTCLLYTSDAADE